MLHVHDQVIEAGYKIKVGIVQEAVHGVDTEEQLKDLDETIAAGKFPFMNLPSLSHLSK